jgi:hypothetical protein
MDTVSDSEVPKLSIPQTAVSKWVSAPAWARGIVVVIITIAGSSAAIIQIIEALK